VVNLNAHLVQARGGATPQLAWALAQAQLQLPLLQAQPLLGLLAFPADICRKCEIIRRKCEIIRRKKVTFCDKFFAQAL